MTREWKPGDVAEVTWDNATGDQVAQGLSRIVTKRGFVVEHSRGLWFLFDVTSRLEVGSTYIKEAKHLPILELPDGAKAGWPVLIDVFERARVATGFDMVFGGLIEQIEAQTGPPIPPKPDEPQGLGAVVEDDKGAKWVLVDPGDADAWRRAGEDSEWSAYAHITAVRVLSVGVSA